MSTVLVTGGSGFVGSHLVLQLVDAGHTVRTTVRSLNREDVASPMPQTAPKSKDELIIPARDAKMKRVVVSSTCGAIYYGHPLRQTPFDETSWTNLDGEMSAYAKSKAIAERAAWDFMAAEGAALELAMINPAAQGERFIAVSGEAMSMLDIARLLKARLGDAAKKVPTRQLPDWLVRLIARFDPGMRQLLPPLGTIRNASSAKAERVLGRTPRSKEDAITATAESLLKFGIVG